MNAFGSLLADWFDLAADFIEKRDNLEQFKTWWNTALGLPFEAPNERLSQDDLRARAEEYEAEVPDGVLLLLCIVDVQSDRLEYEVIGYGEHEESWGIERAGLYGDPMDESAAVWKELDDMLRGRRWKRKSGHGMGVYRCYVDSGYQATTVYQRIQEMKFGSVFPCKGANKYDTPIARAPSWVKLPNNSKLRLFTVGTQDAKTLIAQRFMLTEPGPGYCHLAKDYPMNFYEEMTAEVRVAKTVDRRLVYVWQPIDRRPNDKNPTP